MSSSQIRSEIHQIIDQLDESFLKVVHSMLGTYVEQKKDEIIGYDGNENPLYASIAKKEYEQRIARMNAGDFTMIEEVKNESAEW